MIHNEGKLTFDQRHAHSDALAALRKESLDIYNRLHSIEEDIGFVNQVHTHYPKFPLLPNLRCGAWYTDPALTSETPAYFKSTDGHTGNWGFNLRRANLHLVPLIAQNLGLVLVDSTRAGKRMPDALSKTVPIWCAVVNRAISLRRQQHDAEATSTSGWDVELYTPAGVVSSQEHHQIALRLDGWAKALVGSSFVLPLDLAAPLRPFWITPATATFPVLQTISSSSPPFLPVVCVSASKHVDYGMERRVAGYVHVQGSGDDHELWGMGLTPQLFWKYRKELISSPRADLENLIKQILSSSSSSSYPSFTSPASLERKPSPVPIRRIDGRIQLASFSPSDLDALISSLSSIEPQDANVAYIVLDFSSPSVSSGVSVVDLCAVKGCVSSPENILHILASPKGKAKVDAHFLQHILPAAIPYIKSQLFSKSAKTIYILEGRGNDPGTRLDMSVGLAIAAIQLFFDGDGTLMREDRGTQADKQSIRTRLEWVIESEPRANPSRATLKRVNEFLLTPSTYLTHLKSQ